MKRGCENYLFEDYHWKSGIPIWIPDLVIEEVVLGKVGCELHKSVAETMFRN